MIWLWYPSKTLGLATFSVLSVIMFLCRVFNAFSLYADSHFTPNLFIGFEYSSFMLWLWCSFCMSFEWNSGSITYLWVKYIISLYQICKKSKITHLAISTYKTDNKMKNLKYQTVGIVPNFNRKVVYICNIDTAKTAIIMTANIPGLLQALQQNVAGYI